MRTLTLRIYLTVVAVLALFAFASGWVFQTHIEQERTRAESVMSDRMAAWGELMRRLPTRRRRCATGRSACACRSRSTAPAASASAHPNPFCAGRATASAAGCRSASRTAAHCG